MPAEQLAILVKGAAALGMGEDRGQQITMHREQHLGKPRISAEWQLHEPVRTLAEAQAGKLVSVQHLAMHDFDFRAGDELHVDLFGVGLCLKCPHRVGHALGARGWIRRRHVRRGDNHASAGGRCAAKHPQPTLPAGGVWLNTLTWPKCVLQVRFIIERAA